MSDYTRKEYWEDVASLADEVVERVEDGDDEGDAIHEGVDGSAWIIYYAGSRAVLEHTENKDAYADQGVDLDASKGLDLIITQAAYWAMYQDVADELDNARERLEAKAATE